MDNFKVSTCAKIWDFMLKQKKYKKYAESIDDICSKDALADDNGLTVILPDTNFIDYFTEQIYGNNGSASTSKRILYNTIIRTYLPSTDDMEELGSSLPCRSGITYKIISVNPSKNEVYLSDDIVLKLRDDFKCPKGFKYAVWEVIKGKIPISVSYETNKTIKNKKSKKRIEGGEGFIVNVGNALLESANNKKINLLIDTFNKSKNSKSSDIFLLKLTSLLNWLSIYNKEALNSILPILDINPVINLIILLLDPNGISDKSLFGTENKRDPIHIRSGWNNIDLYTEPYEEYLNFIKKSSGNLSNNYVKSLIKQRNNIIIKNGRKTNIHDICTSIEEIYNNHLSDLQKDSTLYNIDSDRLKIYNNRYGKYKDRKYWEDMIRYMVSISLLSDSDSDNVNFKISDTDFNESLGEIITHKPDYDDYSKGILCMKGKGGLVDDARHCLLLKFLYSTAFRYLPPELPSTDGGGDNNNNILSTDKKVYEGLINGPPVTTSVINLHKRLYKNLLSNKEHNSINSPFSHYNRDWNKFKLGEKINIKGGSDDESDSYEGGRIKHAKSRYEKESSESGNDCDDDLARLAGAIVLDSHSRSLLHDC